MVLLYLSLHVNLDEYVIVIWSDTDTKSSSLYNLIKQDFIEFAISVAIVGIESLVPTK